MVLYCDECCKKFTSHFKLDEHMKRKTPCVIKCNICNTVFKRTQYLKKHISLQVCTKPVQIPDTKKVPQIIKNIDKSVTNNIVNNNIVNNNITNNIVNNNITININFPEESKKIYKKHGITHYDTENFLINQNKINKNAFCDEDSLVSSNRNDTKLEILNICPNMQDTPVNTLFVEYVKVVNFGDNPENYNSLPRLDKKSGPDFRIVRYENTSSDSENFESGSEEEKLPKLFISTISLQEFVEKRKDDGLFKEIIGDKKYKELVNSKTLEETIQSLRENLHILLDKFCTKAK